MAFYESPRFPERIANGALGGPQFSTTVVAVQSGDEYRNASWLYPLHSWDVSHGINGQADFLALRAFFLSMRGKLHGWRFKDFSDYTASHTGTEIGVVTQLTSTTFQLFKRYVSGAQTMDRRILKPVSGSVEIKVSGVTTAHTLDTSTGIVTIGSSPDPATVTWSGEFDIPMRFDTDKLDVRLIERSPSRGLLHEWSSIPIVELRRP